MTAEEYYDAAYAAAEQEVRAEGDTLTDRLQRLSGYLAAAGEEEAFPICDEAAHALEALTVPRPMPDAPRDGTVIIGMTHPELPEREGAWSPSRWAGRIIPMRHEGVTVGGYDMGWSVALPVGHGGLPDEWFKGWIPVPQPWRG